MKKKRIIIVGIIIVLFAGLYMYLKSKENSEKIKINSGYEHQQKVNEFVKKHQSEDPQIEITTNEGGYTMVAIENKQALMKVMSTDQMLLADKKITDELNYIPKLYADCKDLEQTDKEQYFNANIDKINNAFGIKDIETFTKLLNKLRFMEDKAEIKKAIIVSDSAKKVSDSEFTFKLKLQSASEQVFNITMKASNKDDVKLIWD